MQNFQCALCNWDYVDTKIVTDHPDPKLAELTEEEDLNSDFEQICEKYRNENIGFCLQGDVGIKIEKTKSADDCYCGDESNPTADASKVDESNCSADKKIIKEVYTCPCDYAQCEFQPEELDKEPQCEVEDPDSACENADADNKVPGVKKFYEICTCPDGNNGECSRIEEEEQPDYNSNIDYDADPEEGSGVQQFVPAPQKDEQQPDAAIIVKRIKSYEDDQMIVENSTEVIQTYDDDDDDNNDDQYDDQNYEDVYEEDSDEDDDIDSDNDDTIVYDYNYGGETLDRSDFNNTRRRKKRASETEDDTYFSADAEKPKFINYAVGTRLEIKSKREECSFLCAPVAMKEAEPECLEADIYSDWVGEGPCLDINDNEVTCGDAWRKTTRKCKCGPCKHLCDESLLESQDPAIRNCKHQLANEQWPETCPTIPPPAADEACEYGEYEEDSLEIEVDDSDQIDLGLEELSEDQDGQDYIQEDYNNSR